MFPFFPWLLVYPNSTANQFLITSSSVSKADTVTTHTILLLHIDICMGIDIRYIHMDFFLYIYIK